MPPEATWVCPVVKLDLSLNKKLASSAISVVLPVRLSGVDLIKFLRASSVISEVKSVSIKPGATPLTRTYGPNAAAQFRTKPNMAAFEVP